eukprot:7113927-Heterocapsa_arctica.AAC.1
MLGDPLGSQLAMTMQTLPRTALRKASSHLPSGRLSPPRPAPRVRLTRAAVPTHRHKSLVAKRPSAARGFLELYAGTG